MHLYKHVICEINNEWHLLQFVPTELEANGGVSGGASHKFNAIRHGRETAEITKVDKLHKSYNCAAPRLKNANYSVFQLAQQLMFQLAPPSIGKIVCQQMLD